MRTTYGTEPCWVVQDAKGDPWDEESPTHYGSQEEAAREIEDIREREADEDPEWTARLIADTAAKYGKEAGRRAQASEDHRIEHLASLRPVQLGGPCYQITCDGPGDDRKGCDAEPDSDQFTHLHFGATEEFEADNWDWIEVDGKHYCDDCRVTVLCGECDRLAGEGSVDRDGMCRDCWQEELRHQGQCSTRAAAAPA